MHFDQNIIFIIVAAVIGISRLVARISENAREKSRREKKSAPRMQRSARSLVVTPPKTDEERVREFLEALGQPTGTTPPRKVQPRTDVPPRPVAPIPPPPISRPFSPVLLKPIVEKARQIFTPQPAPLIPAASTAEERRDEPGAWMREQKKIEAAAARFETATRSAPEQSATARGAIDTNWKTALRSHESVRAAIVLREILGPPRALRALDLV